VRNGPRCRLRGRPGCSVGVEEPGSEVVLGGVRGEPGCRGGAVGGVGEQRAGGQGGAEADRTGEFRVWCAGSRRRVPRSGRGPGRSGGRRRSRARAVRDFRVRVLPVVPSGTPCAGTAPRPVESVRILKVVPVTAAVRVTLPESPFPNFLVVRVLSDRPSHTSTRTRPPSTPSRRSGGLGATRRRRPGPNRTGVGTRPRSPHPPWSPWPRESPSPANGTDLPEDLPVHRSRPVGRCGSARGRWKVRAVGRRHRRPVVNGRTLGTAPDVACSRGTGRRRLSVTRRTVGGCPRTCPYGLYGSDESRGGRIVER
jgi:hypothetical protein